MNWIERPRFPAEPLAGRRPSARASTTGTGSAFAVAARTVCVIGIAATISAATTALIATMTAAPAVADVLPPPRPPPPPPPPPNPIITPPRPTPGPVAAAPSQPMPPLGWYLMGGVFVAAASPIVATLVLNRELTPQEVWTSTLTAFLGPVGWIAAQQLFPPGSTIGPAPRPVLPPGTAATGHQPADRGRTGTPHRDGFAAPPRGAGFVLDEVVVATDPGVSTEALDALLRRSRIVRLESLESVLLARTYHRLRINPKAGVLTTIRTMEQQSLVAAAQPNYIFRLAQDLARERAAEPKGNAGQYVIGKLHLPEVHRMATGQGVLVAIIDSAIDATHRDLDGAIAAKFDSTAAATAEADPHGTGMASAIASHRELLGVAPRASLLAVRAFTKTPGSGTTFRIIKGLDWAAGQNARIVNMSFAGPADPALHEALAAAHDRGMVLVAAAGNAGAKSPPLYPAADPNVIAVTATDVEDALFTGANRGGHVAVGAPGVDVLVAAPADTYQLTTGTSVAAAEVSAVAALMLERNPALKPDEIRGILMATARHLGAPGRNSEFGAGLVDPREAVEMAPRGMPLTH
jgi:hypothetical protein